jgi:hypothetical protein
VAFLTAFTCVGLAWAQAQQTPVQRAEIAVKESADAKASAERVAGERKIVAEKAAAVHTAIDQALATAKASADKAAEVAKTAQGDAAKPAKDHADKAVAAFKAAEEAAAASKAAVAKATEEKAAADKTLAEKTAAADTAQRRLLAERAYAALMGLRNAHTERAQADQVLAQKTAAFNQAVANKNAADQAAATATAEQAAVTKALADKAAAAKTTLEQASAEKDPAKKKTLQDAATKVEAERVAAEKVVAEKNTVAKAATDKAAAAKAAADTATAERTAAEQTVNQRIAAITVAQDAAAATEAEALGGLKPIAAGQWDYAKARHLLVRAGFGGPPEEVARLHGMGLHAAVDFLVNYHAQPPSNVLFDCRPLERPMAFEGLLEGAEQNQLANERNSREQGQLAALRYWWLRRMAETARPLEEKLTLFWHDHFATGIYDKINWVHPMYKQNELFRVYADQYEPLMRGIVKDPAMIIYLDNQVNRKGSGNENLGREVLELFSLGRDQGYGENDLRQLAKALTGHTVVNFPYVNEFRFNGTEYDEGPKTILGQTGNYSADQALDIVFGHPATGRYISKKLFEFFAHREPSEDVINRLSHVMRTHGYDLAPMLRNLFLSEEFYSERTMAQHVKSPVELMIGTIRTLKIQNPNYGHVDGICQVTGQTLFQPPNVAGWEEGRFWISANRVLVRYNGVADLVEQPNVDVLALVEGKANNPAELVDFLARALLVSNLTDKQRQELITFVGTLPPPAEWSKQRDQINARLRVLAVLLMSTPEYQVS